MDDEQKVGIAHDIQTLSLGLHEAKNGLQATLKRVEELTTLLERVKGRVTVVREDAVEPGKQSVNATVEIQVTPKKLAPPKRYVGFSDNDGEENTVTNGLKCGARGGEQHGGNGGDDVDNNVMFDVKEDVTEAAKGSCMVNDGKNDKLQVAGRTKKRVIKRKMKRPLEDKPLDNEGGVNGCGNNVLDVTNALNGLDLSADEQHPESLDRDEPNVSRDPIKPFDLSDYACSSKDLPFVLWRVTHSNTQSLWTHSFSSPGRQDTLARDYNRPITTELELRQAVEAHIDWCENKKPSCFLSVLSDEDHARNWAAKCKGYPDNCYIQRIDPGLLEGHAFVFNMTTLKKRWNLNYPFDEHEYLILHHIPAECVKKTWKSEGKRKLAIMLS